MAEVRKYRPSGQSAVGEAIARALAASAQPAGAAAPPDPDVEHPAPTQPHRSRPSSGALLNVGLGGVAAPPTAPPAAPPAAPSRVDQPDAGTATSDIDDEPMAATMPLSAGWQNFVVPASPRDATD